MHACFNIPQFKLTHYVCTAAIIIICMHILYVTDRKHCVTDYFLCYVTVCINSVCTYLLFSSSPCTFLLRVLATRDRRAPGEGVTLYGDGPVWGPATTRVGECVCSLGSTHVLTSVALHIYIILLSAHLAI